MYYRNVNVKTNISMVCRSTQCRPFILSIVLMFYNSRPMTIKHYIHKHLFNRRTLADVQRHNYNFDVNVKTFRHINTDFLSSFRSVHIHLPLCLERERAEAVEAIPLLRTIQAVGQLRYPSVCFASGRS